MNKFFNSTPFLRFILCTGFISLFFSQALQAQNPPVTVDDTVSAQENVDAIEKARQAKEDRRWIAATRRERGVAASQTE